MSKLTKEELIHIITHPESASMHRVHLVARELLSLREQLAELKALEPVAWRNRFTGYLHSNKPGIVDDCYDELFTAAKPINVSVIQDELIEQVGVMCDQATNIEEKNVYGHAYCVLKYGILPYLRKQGK